MESRAGVEEYRRLREPDPEMEDGGYRTPHKPIYATVHFNCLVSMQFVFYDFDILLKLHLDVVYI